MASTLRVAITAGLGAIATVAQGRRRMKAVIYSQAGGPEMLRVVERAHRAVRLFDNLGEPKPTLR